MNLKSNILPGVLRHIKCTIIQQQIRRHPRWSHGRPVQIIAPEDYDENTDTVIKKPTTNKKITEQSQEVFANSKIKWKQPNQPLAIKKNYDPKSFQYSFKTPSKPLILNKSNTTKAKSVDMLDLVIDEDGNFIYTKMNDNDLRISQIMLEVKSKKEKTTKDLMLLEGKRLIKEALDAKCKLKYILFSRITDVDYLKPSLPNMGAQLYKIPYRDMQMWSDLVTNPGIMGIFKIPDTESYEPPDEWPITVICDNVREPSNLGSILRTASGVGCKEIILTKGCCNLWDTKVLRSACGAHFKLRIKRQLDWEKIQEEIDTNSHIFVADNNDTTEVDGQQMEKLNPTIPILPYYGVHFLKSQHIVVIIGGETEGISQECYQFAAERKGLRLNVPLSNNVDSLNTNTAFGVIAFEIKRQMLTAE